MSTVCWKQKEATKRKRERERERERERYEERRSPRYNYVRFYTHSLGNDFKRSFFALHSSPRRATSPELRGSALIMGYRCHRPTPPINKIYSSRGTTVKRNSNYFQVHPCHVYLRYTLLLSELLIAAIVR